MCIRDRRDFWQQGMESCKDWEAVITLAMRGDGDEPMSEDANISLLQNIVKDQRKIIEKVTGKKAKETPQVWALYKMCIRDRNSGMTLEAICCFSSIPVFIRSVNSIGIPDLATAPP